jgi:hypothetical protein
MDCRTVYWAANLGEMSVVKAAIEFRRLSPFTKCFKDRNIITAAIMGGKIKVLTFLLSNRYRNPTAKKGEP